MRLRGKVLGPGARRILNEWARFKLSLLLFCDECAEALQKYSYVQEENPRLCTLTSLTPRGDPPACATERRDGVISDHRLPPTEDLGFAGQ